MADTSQPEEPFFGKRKRSLETLVHVSDPPDTATYQSTQSNFLGSVPLPKRPRLPKQQSGIGLLPSGLLQHVFSYVDPFSLASIAAVNRLFRSLLDERYAEDIANRNDSKISPKTPDAIWSQSRRHYLTTMPKPVAGLSERAQFLLAFGLGCDFCGKRPLRTSLAPDPWHAGPGEHGVRILWPFRIRSCTTCLLPRIRKDAEILLSEASPLLPGLPFALFTQSMDYIPEGLVRDGLPFGTVLQKFCFKSDIDVLDQQLQQAKSFGSAAAEEWLKGMPGEGKAAQNDAARFQQWESNGQLHLLRRALDYRFSRSPTPTTSESAVHVLPARPPTLDASYSVPSGTSAAVVSALPPMPTYGLAPGLEPPQAPIRMQSDSMSMDSCSSGTSRAAKSSRDRAKLRSQKKADIIERCQKLIPPITKDELEDLDAFGAALKVPMPLNDNSWPLLRDSLQQQRRKAMLADEAKNSVRTAPIPGVYIPTSHSDEFLLANAGTPKRERLCKIAEDFIRQKWGFGGFVTYPTSPQFAAEVLIHTRKTYENERLRASSIQASSGFLAFPHHHEEHLKLEDMKWVFDQTIKPRTEQIRKDLFVCPVCPTIESVKYFAFESIIQHYASKHTKSFSRGTQMVSWKADWPVSPPFSEHPDRVHTPTPSLTHTPTLTNVPLSAISSGSLLTSTVPSIGWHTPDNMSLASSNSRTYSAAGSSVPASMTTVMPPGPAMYEAQRENLSSGLLRNSNMLPAISRMPASLKLYLTIALATAQFKEKWSNTPGLTLFRDCLQAKRELGNLKDIESLKCAECAAAGEHDARARWSLFDLVLHFQSVHIDQRAAGSKLDWKNDMILLPEPEIVKYEQSDPALPEFLRPYLADAITTSTLQSTNTNIPKMQRVKRPEAYRIQHLPNYTPTTTDETLHFQARCNEDELYSNAIIDKSQVSRAQIEQSIAATYGDLTMTRDGSLASTSYNPYPHERPHSFDYNLDPQRHQSRHMQPSRGISGHQDDRKRATSPQAESMTRTNTVRSYKSRDEPRASIADDFLSTIDAYVDIEMADPQVHYDTSGDLQSASSYVRPVATQSLPSEVRPRYIYEPRVSAGYSNRVDSQVMRRELSRVVEFGEDGTPVSYNGHVYQEVSPRRSTVRHENGLQPPQLTQLPVDDSQAFRRREHEYHSEVSNQPGRAVYSTYPYRRVEYIAESPWYTQRPHNEIENHQYVEISAPVRRYIEIDDSDHRTMSTRSVVDRPIHYHDVGSQERAPVGGGLPSRLPEYEQRGFYRQ